MRLIAADSLETKIKHLIDLGMENAEVKLKDVLKEIEKCETVDAVPVVRCINCIHLICEKNDEGYARCRCYKTGLDYGPYFYCAEGYQR